MITILFQTAEPNLIDRLAHGKRSVAVNLKHEDGRGVLRRLCSAADVLIDPFRPGESSELIRYFALVY